MARVVSIHSFRGGTGKSNITANLAALLALRGERVGVIDTDIQSPGIHILFGMEEEHISKTLNDYLWGQCSIEDTAYDVGERLGHSALEAAGGAIYLIPSSLRAGEITRILREGYDVGTLNEGFRDLIRELNLDYLLIDTHPGLNEETLLSIAISDCLVIVLRPDQQDFQGTAVTVDVARRLDVPQILLVVNKALSSYDLDALRDQVESTYECSVAAVLPLSEEVAALQSADLAVIRLPDHSFSKGMEAVVQAIEAGK
jgi:MinD-like ATPase involved in chromosome partitioning or flagellar assembly